VVSPAIEDTEGDTEEEDERYTDYTYEGMYTPPLPGREQESVPRGRIKSKLQNVTQTKLARNKLILPALSSGLVAKEVSRNPILKLETTAPASLFLIHLLAHLRPKATLHTT